MSTTAEQGFVKECVHAAGIVHRGTDEPREDVIELMLNYRKSLVVRLAEEAERKSESVAKENPLHDDQAFMWLAFAAWLRQKAEERG